MCKKASQQLNVLKRIDKYLNSLGRLTIYYSFIFFQTLITVRLHGTFAEKKYFKKLKKNQERALRFIYEDYENTY